MSVHNVNALSALLSVPVGAPHVTLFVSAAGKALGHRTDSELARRLAVKGTTLASWKRRGSIPDEQWEWFASLLIPKIATCHPELPQVSRTARAAVVELLSRTGGNPMGIERYPMLTTAEALGGLLALAELFADLKEVHPAALNSRDVGRIADLMGEAMPQFKQGAEITSVTDLSQ